MMASPGKRKANEDPSGELLAPHKQQRIEESSSPIITAHDDGQPVSCLHDVSYPEGYVPPPPRPDISSDSKPAKEFPFTLDSFQTEAIKCLDGGQSVMVALLFIHT